jgi:glutamine amidotransferase
MSTEIGIIDYGMSNILSIVRALEKTGARPVLIKKGSEVAGFEKIILPGVGAFPLGMEGLKQNGFFDEIRKVKQRNQYLLGVCLGMQMLMSESEEITQTGGLNLIPGKVLRLPAGEGFKIPNVNWHKIIPEAASEGMVKMFAGLDDGAYMYFVHSYYVVPERSKDIMTRTTLETFSFASSVSCDRIFGVQFHPEKSGEKGLQVLHNFCNL